MAYCGPTAFMAHKRTHQLPSSELPLHSRVEYHAGKSPPRSRVSTPRVDLRLTRGSRPSTQGISTTPPDQGIKCPVTSRAPRARAESPPCRFSDTEQESVPGPVQPYRPCATFLGTIRALCKHCSLAVRRGRGHSQVLCYPLPSFLPTAPLERARRHPRKVYDC
jgi:hypothetical protein